MKIGLGLPIVGHVPAEAFVSHLRVLSELKNTFGSVYTFTPIDTFPHDRARALIVNDALAQGCEGLLFLDADMVIPPGAVKLLWETFSKGDVVMATGHYLRRGWPFTCVWSKKVEGEFYQVDPRDDVTEIDVCGLGFAFVDLTWVKDNLTPPYFDSPITEEGREVRDDTTFCDKIRAKGGRIVGDSRVECGHLFTRVCITKKNADYLRRAHLEEDN